MYTDLAQCSGEYDQYCIMHYNINCDMFALYGCAFNTIVA